MQREPHSKYTHAIVDCKLIVTWNDGVTEDLSPTLPDFLREQIEGYLDEMDDLRTHGDYTINETIRNAVGKQMLIDSVMRQVVRDIHVHDLTAIEELLKQVPEDYLRGFLPEGETP